MACPLQIEFGGAGGPVMLIAVIEDPGGIAKILTHLGLPTKAPPRAPAQVYPLFRTA